MDNVVKFQIPPKSMNRSYKKHKYTVTYIPSTKQWSWEVEVVQTTKYNDTADTQIKAFRAAERCIDSVLKIQGKEAK